MIKINRIKLRIEEKQRCAVDELTQSHRQASAQDEPDEPPSTVVAVRFARYDTNVESFRNSETANTIG
jgi:hypothetical protein